MTATVTSQFGIASSPFLHAFSLIPIVGDVVHICAGESIIKQVKSILADLNSNVQVGVGLRTELGRQKTVSALKGIRDYAEIAKTRNYITVASIVMGVVLDIIPFMLGFALSGLFLWGVIGADTDMIELDQEIQRVQNAPSLNDIQTSVNRLFLLF